MSNDIKTPQHTINDQHIDDMISMQAGAIKTKANVILDFKTAAKSNLSVEDKALESYSLFNNNNGIASFSARFSHVNFIDSASLSDKQKQHLLDHNALDLSQKPETLENGIALFPQSGMAKILKNLQSQNVDHVHVLGDISGMNVALDKPSILPTSTNPVNLDEHKAYPFTQKSGKTEFTFWGENNDAAYHNALEKEARQGILSKTINIDEHDIKDHVILFADETPPISYDPA